MARKILLLTFCLFLGGLVSSAAQETPLRPLKSIESFKKAERVLVLVPHPDDEAIACAGVIQSALSAGSKLKIVYLTNGDHNQLSFIVYEKRLTVRKGEFVHMGEVRKKEALAAMNFLGVNKNDLVFLGYPDFGTFNMFSEYWASKKPYKDMMTRISSVPYKENFSYGSLYVPENILKDIEQILLDYKPDKIFVSHQADKNVDHKTFYLFLEIALEDLKGKIPEPKVYQYLVHRLGWPLPRHYHPELALEPPEQFLTDQFNWSSLELSKVQIDKKQKSILFYRSQTRVSAFYLLAFARKNELFGDCPDIVLKPQVSLQEKAVQFFGFSSLYPDPATSFFESPDNLVSAKEHASYAVVDNSLLIRIEKSQEHNKTFFSQLYLFGYNSKIPFAQMPKIKVITKYNKYRIFNGKKLLKDTTGVSLLFNPEEIILKLPLSLLGSPDFIFSFVRAYKGNLPAEASGFKKIVIK